MTFIIRLPPRKLNLRCHSDQSLGVGLISADGCPRWSWTVIVAGSQLRSDLFIHARNHHAHDLTLTSVIKRAHSQLASSFCRCWRMTRALSKAGGSHLASLVPERLRQNSTANPRYRIKAERPTARAFLTAPAKSLHPAPPDRHLAIGPC